MLNNHILLLNFIQNLFLLYRRSSSQIYNVTMFFLFFMSLYAILGVQFFGALTFHCVRNGTDIK
jgi:hypothetical protein